jgi:hypothetical protein
MREEEDEKGKGEGKKKKTKKRRRRDGRRQRTPYFVQDNPTTTYLINIYREERA